MHSWVRLRPSVRGSAEISVDPTFFYTTLTTKEPISFPFRRSEAEHEETSKTLICFESLVCLARLVSEQKKKKTFHQIIRNHRYYFCALRVYTRLYFLTTSLLDKVLGSLRWDFSMLHAESIFSFNSYLGRTTKKPHYYYSKYMTLLTTN